MSPKRSARQSPPPSELNSSASDPSSSTGAPPVAPSLSSLSPKACLTCGRMITPRAKWAKNWAEIKTCSDACKAFKVGSRGNIASVPREEIERGAEEEGKSKSMEGSVKETLRALAGKDDEGPAQIDVDAWIELALLRCAAPPSASSTLPTTDDVDAALERVARSCGDTPLQRKTENAGSEVESSNEVPPRTLLATLQSGPGLRERVRRAARRLFILPVEHWACRDVVEHKAVEARTSLPLDGMERGLDLVQGGKVLKGLEGVSFAKGPIGLKRRQR